MHKKQKTDGAAIRLAQGTHYTLQYGATGLGPRSLPCQECGKILEVSCQLPVLVSLGHPVLHALPLWICRECLEVVAVPGTEYYVPTGEPWTPELENRILGKPRAIPI